MTSTGIEQTRPPLRFSRARDGRLLGGVCAGLPRIWGLGVNGLRLMFVLAGLCGGIGVVLYFACWLIMPVSDTEPDPAATPSVVLLAGASGGLVVLLLAGAFSAVLTVFGLGWVIFVIAAVVLVATLGPLAKRLPASLGLLAVTALAVPSLIVALTPLRIDLQDGPKVSAPATAAAVERQPFSSGFGTQFVDLRHTALPSHGTVTLRIHSGLRRTIVALPSDRCVRVQLSYAVHPYAEQLATLVAGRPAPAFHGVVLFGSVYGATSAELNGSVSYGMHASGPTLKIDFTSQGGGLYVRDYPDSVDPQRLPNWPGFLVTPERRPNLDGEPHQVAVQMVRNWRQRRAADILDAQKINPLIGGPCAS